MNVVKDVNEKKETDETKQPNSFINSNINSFSKHDIRTPWGTRDYLPLAMHLRNQIKQIARQLFEEHGLEEMETPHLEVKKLVLDQYGENSKQVYDVYDGSPDLCILRYDQTASTVRALAQHGIEHLRRYMIGYVFRRDQPSPGRLRSFVQMDFDLVGKQYVGEMADAELLHMCVTFMIRFTSLLTNPDKFSFTILYNHRELLEAILLYANIPCDKIAIVCSSIDQLDKKSWSEVEKDLLAKQIAPESITSMRTIMGIKGHPKKVLIALNALFEQNLKVQQILENIHQIFSFLEIFGSLDKIQFSLNLARGLDYYTGSIFEIVSNVKEVGSLGGGGRYDRMYNKFDKSRNIPAIGGSFGLERLFYILEKIGPVSKSLDKPPCFVTFLGKENTAPLQAKMMKIASILWQNKIPAVLNYQLEKPFKKQLTDVLSKGIDIVIFTGETELADNKVVVKQLSTKQQTILPFDELVSFVLQL